MNLNPSQLMKLLPPAKALWEALKSRQYVVAAKHAATILVYVAVFSGLVVITTGCSTSFQPTMPQIQTGDPPPPQKPITVQPG